MDEGRRLLELGNKKIEPLERSPTPLAHRGDGCRFRHESAGKSPRKFGPNKSPKRTSRTPSRSPGGKRKFSPYGRRKRARTQTPKRNRIGSLPGRRKRSQSEGKKNGPRSKSRSLTPGGSHKICPAFVNGACPRGQACRMAHPEHLRKAAPALPENIGFVPGAPCELRQCSPAAVRSGF